jgi:hypothetical protein
VDRLWTRVLFKTVDSSGRQTGMLWLFWRPLLGTSRNGDAPLGMTSPVGVIRSSNTSSLLQAKTEAPRSLKEHTRPSLGYRLTVQENACWPMHNNTSTHAPLSLASHKRLVDRWIHKGALEPFPPGHPTLQLRSSEPGIDGLTCRLPCSARSLPEDKLGRAWLLLSMTQKILARKLDDALA